MSSQPIENEHPLNVYTKHGELKIFFGYAAGVGKTYAMLAAAHEAKVSGIDVVIGYIQPHSRPETSELVAGLEVIPTKSIDHNGLIVQEFDIDTTLKRKPELVLVDELAHTNAKNSRHEKRYQDIEELLRLGIDVYTTVNVQHIESLNNLVAEISNITVNERIPDRIFDRADQVEVIDIEPEELISRLKKGKIYKEEQADRAMNNFFTEEVLIALREITLRRTADKINKTDQTERAEKNQASYFTQEHILVCLSASKTNGEIVRNGAQIAEAFHAKFTALYIETGDDAYLQAEEKAQLAKNKQLAEQLGAYVVTLYSDDIADQIAEYAKTSRVSKIVLGKTNLKRSIFSRKKLVDQLSILASNIDIFIIPDSAVSRIKRKKQLFNEQMFSVIDFAKTFSILAVATIIGYLLRQFSFGEASIITIYILSVVITALVTNGKFYGAIASILSVLVFDFFFTSPYFSLEAHGPVYVTTFFVMLVAAFITSTLIKRTKEQVKESAKKMYRTEILLETTRIMQQARSKNDIILATIKQINKLLETRVSFYQVEDGQIKLLANSDHSHILEEGNEPTIEQSAIIQWVYLNRKHAGAATKTFATAQNLYLAIISEEYSFGVVEIDLGDEHKIESFDESILVAILADTAMALEKEKLTKIQQQSYLEIQQEKLKSNLLRAISHDIRTPLTSIIGNAGILKENNQSLTDSEKEQAYVNIHNDAMWLIDLVENLLSLTKVEENVLLDFQVELVEDVVNESVARIKRTSGDRKITTHFPEELILAPMNGQLLKQVIINLIDNALKYSDKETEVIVNVEKKDEQVLVSILDQGQGVPDSEKEKLFDLFYTSGEHSSDDRRGIGLGLYLSKEIVEAHNGFVFLEDNKPKGLIVGFGIKSQELRDNG